MTDQAQAHAGDERAYKRGRGKNKPLITAIETSNEGRPLRMVLRPAKTFRLDGV